MRALVGLEPEAAHVGKDSSSKQMHSTTQQLATLQLCLYYLPFFVTNLVTLAAGADI